MHYQHFSGIKSFEPGRQPCYVIQLSKFKHLLLPSHLRNLLIEIYNYALGIHKDYSGPMNSSYFDRILYDILFDTPHMSAYTSVGGYRPVK